MNEMPLVYSLVVKSMDQQPAFWGLIMIFLPSSGTLGIFSPCLSLLMCKHWDNSKNTFLVGLSWWQTELQYGKNFEQWLEHSSHQILLSIIITKYKFCLYWKRSLLGLSGYTCVPLDNTPHMLESIVLIDGQS